MNSEQNMIARLENWKRERIADAALDAGKHLDEFVLHRLSGPGGLKEAAIEERDHLSRCPACLEQWAEWRKCRSIAEEDLEEDTDLVLGFGYQQAAASTAENASAIQRSSCGRFALNILPPMDASGRTLVAIEILDEKLRPTDTARVSLYDRNGRCVLKGLLQDGRLARTISTLDGFDLSSWSIVIDNRPDQTA